MKYLFTILFLLVVLPATAQVKPGLVSLRVHAGVGLSIGTERMFGEPFFISGEVGLTLPKRWQLIGEVGITSFRDAAYPTQNIGFLDQVYSRYAHQYAGVTIGRNILSFPQGAEIYISTGADVLIVQEPYVEFTGGIIKGYRATYETKRCLNIPVQIAFYSQPLGRSGTRVVGNGRWNINSYHPFPTISAGVTIPF
jgi:hypothetical protein